MAAWEEVVKSVTESWGKIEGLYQEDMQKRIDSASPPPDYSSMPTERLSLGGVGSPRDAQMDWDNPVSRNIVPAAESIGKGFDRVRDAWDDPNIGVSEAVARTGAETVGAGAKAVGGLINTGLDAFIPGTAVGEFIEDSTAKGVDYLANTTIGKEATELFSTLTSEDKARLQAVGGLLEAVTYGVGGRQIGNALRDHNAASTHILRTQDGPPNPNGPVAPPLVQKLATSGVAGLRDYLPNWYGPGDKLPSPTELLALNTAEGIKGLFRDLTEGPNAPLHNKKDNKTDKTQFNPMIVQYRKIVGATGALGKDAFAALWLTLSPKARAAWASEGVSKNSQDIIKRYLEVVQERKSSPPLAPRFDMRTAKKELDNPSSLVFNETAEGVPRKYRPKYDKLWNLVGFDSQKYRRSLLLEQQGSANRAINKVVGQLLYQTHIGKQSGQLNPNLAPSLLEIAERSMLQPGTTYVPGVLSAMWASNLYTRTTDGFTYKRNSRGEIKVDADGKRKKVSNTEDVPLTREEGRKFEVLVANGQQLKPENEPIIAMKYPESVGGEHFNDVVFGNPANTPMLKVMEKAGPDGKVPMPVFREQWEELTASAKNKWQQKVQKGEKKEGLNEWKILSYDEDGVWLKGGLVGKSVVEGGVQWFAKYHNDGRISVVMADTHDFFENLPGIGGLLKRLLPTDLVAVTPIMQTTIHGVRPTQMPPTRTTPKYSGPRPTPAGDRSKFQSAETTADDFVGYEPPPAAVGIERALNVEAGKGAGLMAAAVVEGEEEQQRSD